MAWLKNLLIKELLWPWGGSTFMAVVGVGMALWSRDAFVITYGFTPLMAVPFMVCLMHLWPRNIVVTMGLLLAICYGAQLTFARAIDVGQSGMVWLIASFAAVLTGIVSARLGARHRITVMHAFALAVSGATSMLPISAEPSHEGIWIVFAVWLWQCSVGSLLVLIANRTNIT